ncbi:hypothetical protein [Paraburkholderia hospita]|nr:hypothetical protein [Paraburkholderia hospita]
MERDFERLDQINRGKVALGKSFSLLVLMLATAFFGIFCFMPEQMALPTRFGVPVSIFMFVGLIVISLVISSLFVVCAEKNEIHAYDADVAEAVK